MRHFNFFLIFLLLGVSNLWANHPLEIRTVSASNFNSIESIITSGEAESFLNANARLYSSNRIIANSEDLCIKTAPLILAPINITNSWATIGWNSVNYASSYQIYTIYIDNVNLCSNLSYEFTELPSATTINWKVRALCVGGALPLATSSFTSLNDPVLLNQSSLSEVEQEKNYEPGTTLENVIELCFESQTIGVSIVVNAEVKVFRNPANESVNIQIHQAYSMNSIILYDLSGRVLQRVEGIHENFYKMQLGTQISAGIYLLKIEGNEFSGVRRLIITR